MGNKSIVVVFGGQDHEEAAARAIAKEAGYITATATIGGVKVHAGNAYKADGFVVEKPVSSLSYLDKVIIFECSPAVAGDLDVINICDHHNPGDFGYGMEADQHWEASSLGQLCCLLDIERTHELELVSAGDHCPADAYAGRCQGVHPEEFLDFRISQKAGFYANHPKLPSKTVEEIRIAIKAAQKKLSAAEVVDGVRDLRGAGRIDELPEAALSMGEAYMASLPDTDRDRKPTGNTKIVLGGHTTPEAVTQFMEWGNSLENRVGKAYGNPTRGFAGVIIQG